MTPAIVRPEAAEPRGPLGVVLRSNGAAPVRLSAGGATIGTESECELVLVGSGVSRRHARVELVPEGVRVTDLGSRNGTYYLGQRIECAIITLGATIVLGTTPVALDADVGSLGETLWPEGEFRGMVGESVAMRRVFSTLARLEGSLATVLIGGESGTGKELIAHAIHDGSSVHAGPFVTVNCGAIAKELVLSELFGHTRGAFTGAVASRRGAFETADGGTVFLDEIGELPLDVQPMLLRVLETGEIRAAGSDESRAVRVRVIAATNRQLALEVREGRFREDLFYRLAVVQLLVPTLRERVDDVVPIALRIAAHARVELPPHVLEQLKARAWPGNVRELRNVVHAFAALGSLPPPAGRNATAFDLALGDLVDGSQTYAQLKDSLVDRFTRVFLQRLLARTDGNQTAAAKLAGLDRTYFGRLLGKHGLSRE